jgi:hypothetical protein
MAILKDTIVQGDINVTGALTAKLQTSDIAISSGDKLVVTDSSDGNKVVRASLTFGTGTTTFLRNDGIWYTPTDTKYTAGSGNNSSDRLFLIGATSQNLSGATTYSNGNVYTQSNGVYASNGFYQSSDIRKKNVLSELPLDKAYGMIDKCQEILYTLKEDESNKEQIGLIAQEVREFFPEIVSEDENGMLSLDYARLTVVILRVLKDLITRVSKLENI